MSSRVHSYMAPAPEDTFRPHGTLHLYPSARAIPIIYLDAHNGFSINLGCLSAEQAAAWLEHLAQEATVLAARTREAEARGHDAVAGSEHS